MAPKKGVCEGARRDDAYLLVKVVRVEGLDVRPKTM